MAPKNVQHCSLHLTIPRLASSATGKRYRSLPPPNTTRRVSISPDDSTEYTKKPEPGSGADLIDRSSVLLIRFLPALDAIGLSFFLLFFAFLVVCFHVDA